MIMTGFFADIRVNASGGNGVFYERGELLRLQVITIVTVVPLVFIVSYLLCILTNFVVPMRVDADVEKVGLDTSQHGETVSIELAVMD
jgi:ammonium transporter, Amt family